MGFSWPAKIMVSPFNGSSSCHIVTQLYFVLGDSSFWKNSSCISCFSHHGSTFALLFFSLLSCMLLSTDVLGNLSGGFGGPYVFSPSSIKPKYSRVIKMEKKSTHVLASNHDASWNMCKWFIPSKYYSSVECNKVVSTFSPFCRKNNFVLRFPLYFIVFWHLTSSTTYKYFELRPALWLKMCYFTCSFNIYEHDKELNFTQNVTYDLLAFTWHIVTLYSMSTVKAFPRKNAISAIGLLIAYSYNSFAWGIDNSGNKSDENTTCYFFFLLGRKIYCSF